MLVWAGQGLSYIIALFALIAGTEFARETDFWRNLLLCSPRATLDLLFKPFSRRYDSVAHPEVIPSLVLRPASHHITP
jgi:hypothetical protein